VYVAPNGADDDDEDEVGWRCELRAVRGSHYLRTVGGTAASSGEKGTAWARGRSVASRVCARNAEMRKDAYDRVGLSLPSL